VPFPAREVGGDLFRREILEAHVSFAQPFAERAAGRQQRHGREHPVAAAGEQLEALARRGFVLGFGEDPPSHGDDRIACQHESLGIRGRQGFLARHAPGMVARQFVLARGLVDAGVNHPDRLDPQPREQFAPPRAG